MPILRINILFFLLLITVKTFAQQADTIFYSIDDALIQPDQVQYLYVDAVSGDDSVFFANIAKFKNIKILTINGFSGNELAEKIGILRNIEQLNIVESPDLILKSLLSKLSLLRKLNTLCINDCDLYKCPREIRDLASLQTLIIADNEEFDAKDLVRNISKLGKLKTLALPINQITELPENIGQLKQIEVLDISNNWLTDLPDKISGMQNLADIDMSGNIIINPFSTLGKLKSLSIRYINLDKGLTDDEKEKLSKLFPNAQITEISSNGDEDTLDVSIPDTLSSVKIKLPDLSASTNSDTVEYGIINIEGETFQVYSQAYLHYAAIFNSQYLQYDFDSLTFDERFSDTNYINVYKRSTRNIGAVPIFMEKHKGKTAFSFFDFPEKSWIRNLFIPQNNDYNPGINKMYYELNVFKGVIWIYKGELKKRKFKKAFAVSNTRKRLLGRRIPKVYTDIRIYYDQPDKIFTLELKNNSGFKKFIAYPINRSGNMTLEENQKNYTKLYAKYLTTLTKRKTRFHKSLIKEKALYETALNKSIQKTWADFQKLYMSPDEKKISKEDWLEYYDKVIANEKKALYASPLTVNNLERNLVLNKYLEVPGSSVVNNDVSARYLGAYFIDQDSSLLAVAKIIVINNENKTFCEFDGSLGVDASPVMLAPGSSVSIVVQLRNGDMGVLKNETFIKADFKNTTEYTFKVERISKKLGSIGQVVDILNL